MAALDPASFARLLNGATLHVDYTEPSVRFKGIQQRRYTSQEPFDFVFLSRSPEFTPETADSLYAAIEAAFVASH